MVFFRECQNEVWKMYELFTNWSERRKGKAGGKWVQQEILWWTSLSFDQTVTRGNRQSRRVALWSHKFLVLFTSICEHLTVVSDANGNQFPKNVLKNNNNFPKKDYLAQKWVPAKLAPIVRCRQNSCLSENPCCRKQKCFYFGSFSLDDPDCCCYNNNTSMFNSLQCRDNTSDSHTEICVCAFECMCMFECGMEFLHVSDK